MIKCDWCKTSVNSKDTCTLTIEEAYKVAYKVRKVEICEKCFDREINHKKPMNLKNI